MPGFGLPAEAAGRARHLALGTRHQPAFLTASICGGGSCGQIRISKHEYRNKSEARMTQGPKQCVPSRRLASSPPASRRGDQRPDGRFELWSFGFVSDFDIRISSFRISVRNAG